MKESELPSRPFFGVQSRCRRDRRVPSELLEIEFDRLSPAPAPVVILIRSFADQSVAIVSVPAPERHRVYRRRLVMIQGPDGAMRRGRIEVVRRDEALVRYV